MPAARRILPFALLLAVAGLVAGMCARCRSIEVPLEERLGSFDVEPYALLLANCVTADGLVDYGRLRRHDEGELDAFLDAVGRYGPRTTPEAFPTEADRLAYHLNAYNALMLRKWLDAGAVEGGPARTVNRTWFVLDAWRVDDAWVSLNTLEQSIIRPRYREPRIHFALVCGALSCPPLLAEPFDGARLDAQLDDLGRRWLAEPDSFRVLPGGSIAVSRIFDWYEDDFRAMGGLAGVIERYLPPGDPRRAKALAAIDAGRTSWQEYDWTINAAPSAARTGG